MRRSPPRQDAGCFNRGHRLSSSRASGCGGSTVIAPYSSRLDRLSETAARCRPGCSAAPAEACLIPRPGAGACWREGRPARSPTRSSRRCGGIRSRTARAAHTLIGRRSARIGRPGARACCGRGILDLGAAYDDRNGQDTHHHERDAQIVSIHRVVSSRGNDLAANAASARLRSRCPRTRSEDHRWQA